MKTPSGARGLGRRAHRDESGAALIESLVASTLLGVALIVLVGSYSTLAVASRKAEAAAVGQAAVRAQAARIKAAPYSTGGSYTLDGPPTGMTLSLAVEWWDGTSAWSSTSNGNGLERITVTATSTATSLTVATLQVVKANR
jgi:hypothetical protein